MPFRTFDNFPWNNDWFCQGSSFTENSKHFYFEFFITLHGFPYTMHNVQTT